MRQASMFCWVLAGFAAVAPARPAPAQPVPAHDPQNCYCRSAAGRSPVGARACLATPQGWRVAVCAMDQNVTSWSPTPEGCAPVSFRRGFAPKG